MRAERWSSASRSSTTPSISMIGLARIPGMACCRCDAKRSAYRVERDEWPLPLAQKLLPNEDCTAQRIRSYRSIWLCSRRTAMTAIGPHVVVGSAVILALGRRLRSAQRRSRRSASRSTTSSRQPSPDHRPDRITDSTPRPSLQTGARANRGFSASAPGEVSAARGGRDGEPEAGRGYCGFCCRYPCCAMQPA
jgi:hypothetical protein